MACPMKKPRRRKAGGCRNGGKKKKGALKKKCFKAGVMTRNAYLNFLRTFRKSHCGMSPSQIIRQGARQWNRLPPACKCRYLRMALKIPKPRLLKPKKRRRGGKSRGCARKRKPKRRPKKKRVC